GRFTVWTIKKARGRCFMCLYGGGDGKEHGLSIKARARRGSLRASVKKENKRDREGKEESQEALMKGTRTRIKIRERDTLSFG
ncbi:hypothetical protein TorRG33x02_223980, partial [Trema orientale]